MQSYWQGRARRLTARIQLGWFLALAGPRVGGTSLVAAAACLLLRHLGLSAGASFGMAGAALGLAVAWTLWVLWPRRYRVGDALTRLDADLGMQGALLTAQEGLTPWPEPRAVRPLLKWKLRSAGPGLIAAPAVLLAALLIPIASPQAQVPRPVGKPIVWADLQDALDVLEAEPVVEPEQLERWREQLDELQALPSDDWFEHESLEAADTLWEQMRGTMARAEQALEPVERALAEAAAAQTAAEMQRAQADLQRALEGLAQAGAALDPKLAESLARLDPKDLPSMPQEVREALQRQLARAKAAARLARGAGTEPGNKEGPKPGQGGVQRGPGTAPIDLNPQAAPRVSELTERLDLHDKATRDALGDVVRTDAVAPEVDPVTFSGSRPSGGTERLGRGGEAVWKLRLTPSEQALLREYFK